MGAINWNTYDRETRLYKGKNLYKWEDSPGLEHHCGVCARPLHNGRAKGSCIGKHVEPCYRFHQQLHFIGKSHECFGCTTSDEMHHIRHKVILKHLRELAVIDGVSCPGQKAPDSESSKSRRSSAVAIAPNGPATTIETSLEVRDCVNQKLRRGERKKLKKLGPSKKMDVEIYTQDDMDFVSEAIHHIAHESKGGWQGSYVNDKSTKSAALKKADIKDLVSSFDNLGVKTMSDMTPRQRKVEKTLTATSSLKHSSYRGGTRKFTPKSTSADIFDGIDPKILTRLGTTATHPVSNSIARKEMVTKLISAIKLDLDIMAQEELEAEMREEGFWRYAGRTAYTNIHKLRETTDWATGQKLLTPPDTIECLEDEEEEDLSLEDESIEAQPAAVDILEVKIAKTPTPLGKATAKSLNTPGSRNAVEKGCDHVPKGKWDSIPGSLKLDKENAPTLTFKRNNFQGFEDCPPRKVPAWTKMSETYARVN